MLSCSRYFSRSVVTKCENFLEKKQSADSVKSKTDANYMLVLKHAVMARQRKFQATLDPVGAEDVAAILVERSKDLALEGTRQAMQVRLLFHCLTWRRCRLMFSCPMPTHACFMPCAATGAIELTSTSLSVAIFFIPHPPTLSRRQSWRPFSASSFLASCSFIPLSASKSSSRWLWPRMALSRKTG